MHTPNLTDENILKIKELFPSVVTEAKDGNGELKLAVDFDQLKQELSDHIVEGPQERYHLNWPGKREAMLTANAPIAKTLRPCRGESVDFDTTGNLFIEGDNLEALKLLQETYLGKVKMIYIDPPYNTGNDFVYKDNFSESAEKYKELSNQIDAEGNKLVANRESFGRFHSRWCSMMYPRLKIARSLLRDDGVIFLSIDDDEQGNLRKLCDEIYGEKNFISQLVWEKKKKGTFLSNSITSVKEYVLVYAKNKSAFSGLIGEINQFEETYPCVNASNKRQTRIIPAGIKSKYRDKDYHLPTGSVISAGTMDIVLHSDLMIENGKLASELKVEGNWRYRQELMTEYAERGELYLTQDLYLRRIVKEPRYKTLKDLLSRVGENNETDHRSINPQNLFEDGWGSNEDGEEEVRLLLSGKSIMNFPKPRKLIEKLCASVRDSSAIVLDFFAGSSTTAHAVLHLNSIDGGNRRFIMMQLPEECDANSEAFIAGYKNISEISKERIRRAGKQILEGNYHENWNKDVGFRVLKIDTSNMADVYYRPDEIKQADLLETVSNIKDGRDNPEDLLFQVLLDWGVDLTLPIEQKSIQGKAVYFVDKNALAACFDTGVTEQLVKEIAGDKPLRVVFKDNGFVSDAVKINVAQIFRQLSPSTEVKSL